MKQSIRISPIGWHSRGYIPHFDQQQLTQNVCFRLFDSMPQQLLNQWRIELKHLPENQQKLEGRKRIDTYLDNGYGSCFLKIPKIAEIVQSSLLHFDGERYSLHAWCIMPNHVHVLFTAFDDFDVGSITGSWKSYSANECNKLLCRSGNFWQKEVFDRYIRSEKHFQNTIKYIINNPVKAGLCINPEDWPWSSTC